MTYNNISEFLKDIEEHMWDLEKIQSRRDQRHQVAAAKDLRVTNKKSPTRKYR